MTYIYAKWAPYIFTYLVPKLFYLARFGRKKNTLGLEVDIDASIFIGARVSITRIGMCRIGIPAVSAIEWALSPQQWRSAAGFFSAHAQWLDPVASEGVYRYHPKEPSLWYTYTGISLFRDRKSFIRYSRKRLNFLIIDKGRARSSNTFSLWMSKTAAIEKKKKSFFLKFSRFELLRRHGLREKKYQQIWDRKAYSGFGTGKVKISRLIFSSNKYLCLFN